MVPVIWIDDGTNIMVESVLWTLSMQKFSMEELVLDLDRITGTIESTLITQSITKVRKCQLFGVQPGQLEIILGAVSEDLNLSLNTIYLGGSGVVHVSPKILAEAAVKLTRLDLCDCTSGQIEAILTRLANTEEIKLCKLNFYGSRIDVSHLPIDTMVVALMKLENICELILKLILSPGLISLLMIQIRDTNDLKFSMLHLDCVDTSQLASDVLVGAITRLDKVWVNVTPPQLQTLFSRIQFGRSHLKKLVLYFSDLCSLTVEDLLGAFRMLECVRFNGNLTTLQVIAILAMLNDGSQGRLRSLSLYLEEKKTDEDAINLLEAAEGNDILDFSFY